MRKLLWMASLAAGWLAPAFAWAESLHLPANPVAGQSMSLTTSGNGNATLLLIGPGQVIERRLRLGQEVGIKGEELRSAGRWIAIIRKGDGAESQAFWVRPGQPENLNFLARPSRVPVARPSVISGMAFVFDRYQNFILEPVAVKFSLTVDGAGASQVVNSREGVAWINSSSAKRAGAAQFVAAAGGTSVRRVVQQVASDPCNLRAHISQRSEKGSVVETDTVRDCTGNPVPDGTIVSFTQVDPTGRSTVDARVRMGIARAQLPYAQSGTITVAAGVVLGNELRLGATHGRGSQ